MEKNGNHKPLDSLDRAILDMLRKNARTTNADIGREVGLSAPAVAERIRKMEEHGVIKNYTAILDFDKIGLSIQAYVTFKATAIKHPAMLRLFESLPEVVEWHAITGNTCAILKVAVPTGRDLETLLEKLAEHGETMTSLILSGGRR
jgi:Lrp/AsnC family transcriptional regulator, leucine-responsive regulatory protein